ncbi:cytochrome P450 [Triangularia verruculosa]|uniref:Cytochrome P450 n=1 Tax=Triangularia verruculosa TaxID=2587418 RepID=A0AAN6XGX8_9PEZI|nr:cytochrome P450 [Triangularia verruculosa]
MELLNKITRVLSVSLVGLLAGTAIWLFYTIVYRWFFHPLAKYPGPFLAKFTNLYAAYHSWKGDIHKDMYQCHLKYGDRVRYAPNRVTINTANALNTIHAHGNNVKKFDGYKVLAANAPNTLTLTDKTLHARRRRVISQAFSEAGLRLFEPAIRSRIDRFYDVIRSHNSPGSKWTDPWDMAVQFNYLTFDTMTAVAFDADYDLTTSPKYRYIVTAIESANLRLGVISQALELTTLNLDRRLFLSSAIAAWTFGKFLYKLLRTRLEASNTGTKDIFSFLQQCRDPDTGEPLSDTELSTETATFVVAGSDTTATTLAATVYYLTGSPRCYKRACEEVRGVFGGGSEEIGLGPKLNGCVFLRACIDEALRLSPPGGSAPWREVDIGGARIDGEFFPQGCEVGVPVYAMHHHEGYWEEPFRYLPERWLRSAGDGDGAANAEKGKEKKRAYVPFNMGPRSCVGKPLAIAQMMLALAVLLRDFDVRREGQGEEWWEVEREGETREYELREHITSSRTGPVLRFKPRV